MLNAENQTMNGTIVVDSISSLALTLKDSSFTGAINENGAAGKVTVTLDEESAWTLTADSYIAAFEGDLGNVIGNGYQLYVNGTALTGIK